MSDTLCIKAQPTRLLSTPSWTIVVTFLFRWVGFLLTDMIMYLCVGGGGLYVDQEEGTGSSWARVTRLSATRVGTGNPTPVLRQDSKVTIPK